MSREKYSIISRNDPGVESSPEKQGDLSLVFDSSLVLLGTKYLEPRTRHTFSFISASMFNIVKPFLVTISGARPNGIYHGFDASEECVVASLTHLEVGKRYRIYGRLRMWGRKVLHCITAEEICYRTMCYETF